MLIYKITNKITNKVYIGQTTQSLKKRWAQHCRACKKSKTMIHKTMKKYGKENFNIEEIGGANNIAELNYQEWLLIYKNNTLWPNGYNLMEGGGSSGKLSKYSKNKLSKSLKTFHKNKKDKYTHAKSVVNINTGKIYKSAKECWKNNTNTIKTSYVGFQQRLTGKLINNTPFRYVGMEKVLKKNKNTPNSKKVINIKTKEVYNSCSECARKNGLTLSNLSLKLLGKSGNDTPFRYVGMEKVCKKWKGLDVKKGKGLKIINTKTGEIYDSIRECAVKNNIGYSRFSQKMSGKLHNNTNFKYLEG